jgi:hypothetical protein
MFFNQHKIQIYTALSIIGFIIPNIVVVETIINTGGYDFSQLFAVFSLNYYSKFLALDLTIASATFLAYYFIETSKTPIKRAWLALLGTFLVGFSFGFPLFLLLKERMLSQSISFKNKSNS